MLQYMIEPGVLQVPLSIDVPGTSSLYNIPMWPEESSPVEVVTWSNLRFDDNKIVDLAIGEKNVFKRRGQREDRNLIQSMPKRLSFVVDVSGSMAVFNGDGRLDRLCATMVMIMESLVGLEHKSPTHLLQSTFHFFWTFLWCLDADDPEKWWETYLTHFRGGSCFTLGILPQARCVLMSHTSPPAVAIICTSKNCM